MNSNQTKDARAVFKCPVHPHFVEHAFDSLLRRRYFILINDFNGYLSLLLLILYIRSFLLNILLLIFFSFQLSSNIVYNLFSETLQNFDWWDQFFRTSIGLLLFTIFCYYICTLLLRKQSSLINRCGQKYTPIGSLSQ